MLERIIRCNKKVWLEMKRGEGVVNKTIRFPIQIFSDLCVDCEAGGKRVGRGVENVKRIGCWDRWKDLQSTIYTSENNFAYKCVSVNWGNVFPTLDCTKEGERKERKRKEKKKTKRGKRSKNLLSDGGVAYRCLHFCF